MYALYDRGENFVLRLYLELFKFVKGCLVFGSKLFIPYLQAVQVNQRLA